jgi:hypothetical protein
LSLFGLKIAPDEAIDDWSTGLSQAAESQLYEKHATANIHYLPGKYYVSL